MRRDGWESRLQAAIDNARAQPYALGVHDCFRLACQVVEALTGEDRWALFAGRYRTRREAMRLLAEHGSTFEAAGDWFFGAPNVAAVWAQRGDIVCVQTDDGEKHLGVCLGAKTAVLGPEGLLFIPTRAGRCAWRVG